MRCIVVSGPARAVGRFRIFGKEMREYVVRYGKSLPIEVVGDVEVHPESAKVAEFDEDPFAVWEEAIDVAKRGKRVAVFGRTDAGKTTLVTYLANKLCPIYVLDADIGQADIGPPTTISIGYVKHKVPELFLVKSLKNYFVGSLNPEDEQYFESFKAALEDLRDKKVIIDTSGLVREDFLKKELEIIKPDVVITLGLELEGDFEAIHLPVPKYIRKKSREERGFLRRSAFVRHFRGAREVVIPLNLRFERWLIVGMFSNDELEDIGIVTSSSPLKILTHATRWNRIVAGKTKVVLEGV